MEFIVEHQARLAASIERLAEERKQDRLLNRELRKSFRIVVELLKIQESRLDRFEIDTAAVERRTTALENSMAALAASQAHADERLSALIDMVMQDRGRAS
jgi:hypothetical protein